MRARWRREVDEMARDRARIGALRAKAPHACELEAKLREALDRGVKSVALEARLLSVSYLANRGQEILPGFDYHLETLEILRKAQAERFWSRVDKSGECWLWTGTVQNRAGRAGEGYGVTGDCRLAHRVSWQLINGPVPSGAQVLHSCDRPRCVRPEHLRLGSPAENSFEMVLRDRSTRGERSSSAKLTATQVIHLRDQAAAGVSHKVLAYRYGISLRHVLGIVEWRFWKPTTRCSWCAKTIRQGHAGLPTSDGICLECMRVHFPQQAAALEAVHA